MESWQQQQATAVGAIALPVSYFKLKHLRTVSGDPVVVKLEKMPELRLLALAGLPGTSPPEGEQVQRTDIEKATALADYAAPIIEACSSFSDDDGSEVRPAFHFGGQTPSHPKSVPGRLLHLEDLTDMTMEALRLNGYTGGAADEATFPRGRGARPPVRPRPVGVRKRRR